MATMSESPAITLTDALEGKSLAVTRVHAGASQELLYPGHEPNGVWILLEGSVTALSEGRIRRHVATPDRPVMLVPLGALRHRADALLKVHEQSELLHVGISACSPGGELRGQVRELESLLSS
jgi:hypothetical protein